MIETARKIVQLVLLGMVGVGSFVTSRLVGISHLEFCDTRSLAALLPDWVGGLSSETQLRFFCESGDTVIWLTVLAAFLFTGRHRLWWVIATTIFVAAAHFGLAYRDGLPQIGFEDGTKGIDWQDLAETGAMYVSMILTSLLTYGLLMLPGWVVARARPARVADD